MSDVRIFKLSSGEEIIAELADDQSTMPATHILVKTPFIVAINAEAKMFFVPFMPYAEEEITLQKTLISVETKPAPQVKDHYARMTSKVIAPPEKTLIVPN